MTASPPRLLPHPPPAADPLAPVRAALLAQARREAHLLLRGADEAADRMLGEARAEADRLLAAARAQGEADAAAALADTRARARRRARARVLAARRSAYDELTRQARAAARVLGGSEEAATVRGILRERARARLGPAAVVRDTPDGGVLAEVEGRRLVLGPDGLAEDALARLGAQIERLWAP